MQNQSLVSRRGIIKGSVFGVLCASLPNIVFAKNMAIPADMQNGPGFPHDRYPAIKLEIASEVVGYSHFDLDKLKKLVDPRPELAKASWDFGYGDWESAIAASSHVGRIDMVNYLMSKGAAPTMFTYAMLGNFGLVRSIIESNPGIQKCLGPHGISLLQHAKTGLSSKNGNETQTQQLIDYLEKLGDADGEKYMPIEETEKEKFLGDYILGSDTDDGFTVKLNMRKMLSMGKKGKSGGALYRIGGNKFTINGAPSVTIDFNLENGKVVSLTLNEPGLALTAKKQS